MKLVFVKNLYYLCAINLKDMKVIKRFTPVVLDTTTINGNSKPDLVYGSVNDYKNPKQIFDTEEEAIKYAYSINKYDNWIILPVISFDWLEEEDK